LLCLFRPAPSLGKVSWTPVFDLEQYVVCNLHLRPPFPFPPLTPPFSLLLPLIYPPHAHGSPIFFPNPTVLGAQSARPLPPRVVIFSPPTYFCLEFVDCPVLNTLLACCRFACPSSPPLELSFFHVSLPKKDPPTTPAWFFFR